MFTAILNWFGSFWTGLKDLLGLFWSAVRTWLGWVSWAVGVAVLAVDKSVDFILGLIAQLGSALGALTTWQPDSASIAAYSDIFNFANTFFPVSEALAAGVLIVTLHGGVMGVRFVFFVRRFFLP